MSERRIRGVAYVLAATGTLTALLLVATPAEAACRAPDMAALLQAGKTVGVVTRTDDGRGPRSTYRVESEAGGDLPAQVSSTPRYKGPYVFAPDGAAALLLERRERSWEIGWCSDVPLGPAVQRAEGSPTVTSRGPAVAIAAGRFGDSRLVALDRKGRPVAWDRQSGTGTRVSACPGGKTVVSVGSTGERYYPDRNAELAAHDTATLRPRGKKVQLPVGKSQVVAVRCADARAAGVEVLFVERKGGLSP